MESAIEQKVRRHTAAAANLDKSAEDTQDQSTPKPRKREPQKNPHIYPSSDDDDDDDEQTPRPRTAKVPAARNQKLATKKKHKAPEDSGLEESTLHRGTRSLQISRDQEELERLGGSDCLEDELGFLASDKSSQDGEIDQLQIRVQPGSKSKSKLRSASRSAPLPPGSFTDSEEVEEDELADTAKKGIDIPIDLSVFALGNPSTTDMDMPKATAFTFKGKNALSKERNKQRLENERKERALKQEAERKEKEAKDKEINASKKPVFKIYEGAAKLLEKAAEHDRKLGRGEAIFKNYEGPKGTFSYSKSQSTDKKRGFSNVADLDSSSESGYEDLVNEIKDVGKKKIKHYDDGDVTEIASVDLRSPERKSKNSEPVCPRCGVPVSKELLELESKTAIHRRHKKETAQEEWEKLKIPKVNWDNLPDRCKKYYPYLEDITRGKVKSPFRDEAFKKHKSAPKSIRQQIKEDHQWCSPGYYGPHGAEVMSEVLSSDTNKFTRLWDVVCSDKDFINMKFSDYVVEILVPELATRIIMDDMKMPKSSIEKGRAFLRSTQNLGVALHSEEVDTDALQSHVLLSKGAAWLYPTEDSEDEEDEDSEENGHPAGDAGEDDGPPSDDENT